VVVSGTAAEDEYYHSRLDGYLPGCCGASGCDAWKSR
jgi:hypothetical protein